MSSGESLGGGLGGNGSLPTHPRTRFPSEGVDFDIVSRVVVVENANGGSRKASKGKGKGKARQQTEDVHVALLTPGQPLPMFVIVMRDEYGNYIRTEGGAEVRVIVNNTPGLVCQTDGGSNVIKLDDRIDTATDLADARDRGEGEGEEDWVRSGAPTPHASPPPVPPPTAPPPHTLGRASVGVRPHGRHSSGAKTPVDYEANNRWRSRRTRFGWRRRACQARGANEEPRRRRTRLVLVVSLDGGG